jgi:hypothetical protein
MRTILLSTLVALVVVILIIAEPLPAGAVGPSISLPQSFTQTCQTSIIPSLGSTCYYLVTPGTVLPLSGSGFSSSDTYVTLSGIPSDTDSTERCNVTNGVFSCNYAVPDVPRDDLDGGGDTSLVATGSSGDSVTLPLEINFGSGIYPTSGPPGTVVHVYGDYIGAVKFLADTVTAVTFGTLTPSGLQGTGPSVIYNSAPLNNDYCIAGTDGSLNDHGACTFTVPGYSPGSYNVGILVGALWSVPDLTACGNVWCVSTFTIVPPAVSVSSQEATKGSTITVTGTDFATTDTSAKILWRGADITPSSGCPFTTSPSGSSLSCSIQVPTSDLSSPGPNSLTVVGVQYGDYASTAVDIPGPYPLSVSSSQVILGSTITVSGISFDPSDTSVTLSLFQPSNSGPTCPVTNGAFSCSFTIPSNAPPGSTSIFAQGNHVGDYDFADLTIVQNVALSQASGPVGTNVTISGTGFNSRGELDAVSVTFDGKSLPITVTETNDVIGVINGKPVYNSYVGPCPTQNGDGSLPAPSTICSFTVPQYAITGSNTVTFTDEFGNSISTSFTLTPSITLSPTKGSAGSQILLTGYGFPISDTPANFQLNGLLLPSNCIPSSSGFLTCNLTVPSLGPGNYTLEALAVSGQILSFSYTPVANATFTIVPSITLGSTKGTPESTISVQVTGLSSDDSYVAVYLNSTQTSSACIPIVISPLIVTKSFSCTTTLPNVPPDNNYIIKVVGNNEGDSAEANFTVSGLSISPLAGQASTIINVNGYGFDASDTSATFSIDGASPSVTSPQNGALSNGCPVSGGTFACTIQTSILPGGTQQIVATGNAGDYLSTSFTVIPETIIYRPATAPPQGPPGTDVTMGGTGFLASDKSVTVLFNGTNVGTCPAANGSYFCSSLFKVPSLSPGTYYVVVNGSYSAGDTTVNQFVVTVPPDTIPPTTTETLSGTQGTNGWYTSSVSVTLNAADNTGGSGVKSTSYSLDGGPQTTYSGPFTVTGDSNHTLTFNSTDNAGNVESPHTLYVPIDTTPPVITVPSNVTMEATGPQTVVTLGAATANDAIDGPVSVSNNATASYPVGITIIQYTATDLAGNTATAYQSVTITDTTPPVLTLPTQVTAQATGPSGAAVAYAATATDLVDGPIVPICTPTSGSTFAFGTTLVTCTATDAHNNQATGTFNVIVQNNVPPTLSIISPANNAIVSTATVSASGTASDIVSVSQISWKLDKGAVSQVSGISPGPNVNWSFTTGTLSPGTHTIQVNATDSAGLVDISTITVTYAAPTDSIPLPSGSGQTTFSTNIGGFTSLDSTLQSSLPTPPPPGRYPLGFFSWDVTGFTPATSVTITVTSPVTLHHQSQYFKLVGGVWVSVPVTVHGNTMTFTISDNGPFDDDKTSGVIADPAAVAAPTDGRVTGGGNIGKGTNFSFDVRSDLDKTYSITSNLDYNDRYAKLDLDSNNVSFLSVDTTTSQATFVGTGDYDRHDKHDRHDTADTFIVTISDPDKTGSRDTFSIIVTDPTGNVIYQNSGTVNGHIEIHKFADHDDPSDSGVRHGGNNNNGNKNSH